VEAALSASSANGSDNPSDVTMVVVGVVSTFHASRVGHAGRPGRGMSPLLTEGSSP
jgi:hypothetical protein